MQRQSRSRRLGRATAQRRDRARTVGRRKSIDQQPYGANGGDLALEALKRPSTDSVYVRDGITKWIHGWKRNGWKTAAKKPVANAELWQRLDLAAKPHSIDWRWVKGHAGDPDNERVDRLASDAAVAAGRP